MRLVYCEDRALKVQLMLFTLSFVLQFAIQQFSHDAQIRSIRTFMLEYGDSRESWVTTKHTIERTSNIYADTSRSSKIIVMRRTWAVGMRNSGSGLVVCMSAVQGANQLAFTHRKVLLYGRLYHAARLRWNSIDRYRGAIHDILIDELVEWAVYPYSSGE